MSKGKQLGYIRVSSADQNPARQLEGMSFDKVFVDYISGSTTNRPELERLLEYARDDDTIWVHSFDRLARNVKDLRNIIEETTSKGISIKFVKEGLTFTSEKCHMSLLLLNIIGAIAEFELEKIKERQKEGIDLAKKAGKYKGGKPKLGPLEIAILKQRLTQTRDTVSDIARHLKVSRCTLYKYIKKIKKEGQT